MSPLNLAPETLSMLRIAYLNLTINTYAKYEDNWPEDKKCSAMDLYEEKLKIIWPVVTD